MKFGSTDIKGFFDYSDKSEYTIGDFVVEGTKIYIAKANSLGNRPSESPDYFDLYLKNESATVDEYFKYAQDPDSNPEIGKKSISINVLSQILNRYMCGFDDKGLIDSTMVNGTDSDTSKNIIIRDFFNNIQSTINTSSPLDYIYQDKELNNAIFKVSEKVAKDIFSDISTNASDTAVAALLRQYTYLDGNNYTRIQILFEISTGNEFYRYVTWRTNMSEIVLSSESSTWRSIRIN